MCPCFALRDAWFAILCVICGNKNYMMMMINNITNVQILWGNPVDFLIWTNLFTHRCQSLYSSFDTKAVNKWSEFNLLKLLMLIRKFRDFSRSSANCLTSLTLPDLTKKNSLSLCSQTSDTIQRDPYSFTSFCLARKYHCSDFSVRC